MEQKIFSNTILVNKDKQTIRQFLVQGQNLLKWVPAVIVTEQNKNHLRIKRTEPAINQEELLIISEKPDQVEYRSTQGKLEYRIRFNLKQENSSTRLSENVYLEESVINTLPFKILVPIAKHAFNENFTRLATVLELKD